MEIIKEFTWARKLSRVADEVRRLDSSIPLQVVHFFLEVAAKPGMTATEYGRLLDLSNSASARAFRALSEDHWDYRGEKKHGLGLVFGAKNPSDARETQVFMTAKGRRLMEKIEHFME